MKLKLKQDYTFIINSYYSKDTILSMIEALHKKYREQIIGFGVEVFDKQETLTEYLIFFYININAQNFMVVNYINNKIQNIIKTCEYKENETN